MSKGEGKGRGKGEGKGRGKGEGKGRGKGSSTRLDILRYAYVHEQCQVQCGMTYMVYTYDIYHEVADAVRAAIGVNVMQGMRYNAIGAVRLRNAPHLLSDACSHESCVPRG